MSTIISTTIDENVATLFAGNGNALPEFESVLFEIDADLSTKSLFAVVSQHSYMRDEGEVLFFRWCHI